MSELGAYFGCVMLGAIAGFGLAAMLGAGAKADLEAELMETKANADTYYATLDSTQRAKIRQATLKRIQREQRRGHGTPAGEA